LRTLTGKLRISIVIGGPSHGFRSRICREALAVVGTGAFNGGDARPFHHHNRRLRIVRCEGLQELRSPMEAVAKAAIPLPAAALLRRQPEPDCAFRGPVTDPITGEETRQKLDYEQQCYRASESIVRARLGQLQRSVPEDDQTSPAAVTSHSYTAWSLDPGRTKSKARSARHSWALWTSITSSGSPHSD
jgi:hypothetical protein